MYIHYISIAEMYAYSNSIYSPSLENDPYL